MEPVREDEMKAYEPTMRERIASGLQSAFEGLGANRYKARQRAQTITGGQSSNLPLGMGVADVVSAVSLPATMAMAPIYAEEGIRDIKSAGQAAGRGDYVGAGVEGLFGALNLLPAVSGVTGLAKKAMGSPLKPLQLPETPPMPDDLPRRQVRRPDGLSEPEAEQAREQSLDRLRRLLEPNYQRGGAVKAKVKDVFQDFLKGSAVQERVFRGTDAREMISNTPYTHFSKSPDVANTYAGYLSDDVLKDTGLTVADLPIKEGAAVFPAHVSIQKPAGPADVSRIAPDAKTVQEAFPALQAAGYDGYIDNYQVVPFDRSQIRSALEKARGGAVKQKVKGALRQAIDILSPAEREANKAKFLEESKVQERLYHATPRDFSEFMPGGENPAVSGPAIWMSPSATNQPAAHNIRTIPGKPGHVYRDPKMYTPGTNVMPLYSSIKNPVVATEATWKQDFKPFGGGSPWTMTAEEVQRMKEAGHDGILYYNKNGALEEVIAFEPQQVKSAIGNRGTYDPAERDITKARGGLAAIKRRK